MLIVQRFLTTSQLHKTFNTKSIFLPFNPSVHLFTYLFNPLLCKISLQHFIIIFNEVNTLSLEKILIYFHNHRNIVRITINSISYVHVESVKS